MSQAHVNVFPSSVAHNRRLIFVPHACIEDQIVEQPAIGLFAELGWQTVSAHKKSICAGLICKEEEAMDNGQLRIYDGSFFKYSQRPC